MTKMAKKKYYSMSEAAEVCGVNRTTIYRWVSAGKIKAFNTPGGHRRILPEELKKWLEESNLPFTIDEYQNEKKKILIVDDDADVRNYLKKILSGLLIEIDVASDGFEAGRKVSEFRPDLIILDLYMPNMNGFEVCKKLKEDPSTKTIKILVMTGLGTSSIMNEVLELGADGFLNKPSSKKEITTYVEKLLKSK